MNLIDLIIFLAIIFFAWFGSRIGLITAVSSILSGLLGSAAANLLYVKFSVFLPPSPSGPVISYFVIFFSVSAVIFYSGHAISGLMSFVFLGLTDRFLGALSGVVLGAVICGAVLLAAVTVPSKKVNHYVKNSAMAPYIIDRVMAPGIKPFSRKNHETLTKDITDDVMQKIKSLPSPLR